MADLLHAKRSLLNEIMDLAVRADEAGLPVLSVALLLITRGARQGPSTCRYLVNAGACILDSVEASTTHRRTYSRKSDPRSRVTLF